jgi:hypothetical protein
MVLTELTEWMRERGVLHLKHGPIEITLGPEPVRASEGAGASIDSDAKVAEPVKKKPGKDGLYADEQRDAYGRVIDAEE